MGRPQTTRPPAPTEFIQQCFTIGDNSGQLLWRERPLEHFSNRHKDHQHFSSTFAGKAAGFIGPGGKPLVRFTHQGHTRRMALMKVAWIVATGEFPRGAVLPRDGDPWNARQENLLVVKAGPRPFDLGKGGEASSLERRAKATTTLLRTLADNPGLTVPMLSKLVGLSAPCVCTRLGKLADAGICSGPKCDARARWDLTPAGLALVETKHQHVADDLDRDILTMIASAPMRQTELANRAGIASLTVKRRVARLIDAGMVTIDTARRFLISPVGIAALGGVLAPKPPAPWLNVTAISAASARDVKERLEHHSNDDRTAWAKSEHGRMARMKAIETARRNGSERFNAYAELDRTG